MSNDFPTSGYWPVFKSFLSMSFLHFRRNGVGLVMTVIGPLMFLLMYGYAYLLSVPEQTISLGLSHAAVAAPEWRKVFPAEGFRVKEVESEKIADHIREGSLPFILDRNSVSGKAIIHTNPYWRSTAGLVLRAVDAVPTLSDDIDERVHVVEFGRSPFYMLPAIMMMALLNIGLFTAGSKILQERARGTLRMFRMFPISIGWYFCAELLTKLMIAMVLIVVYLGVAILMFNLEQTWQQISEVVLISLLMSSVFIVSGFALGSVLKSHSLGIHAFTICNLLVLFLGDFFFNASRYPLTKWISLMLPTPYGMDLMRHSMFGYHLNFPVSVSISVLLSWLCVMLMIAIWMFNYKTSRE